MWDDVGDANGGHRKWTAKRCRRSRRIVLIKFVVGVNSVSVVCVVDILICEARVYHM